MHLKIMWSLFQVLLQNALQVHFVAALWRVSGLQVQSLHSPGALARSGTRPGTNKHIQIHSAAFFDTITIKRVKPECIPPKATSNSVTHSLQFFRSWGYLGKLHNAVQQDEQYNLINRCISILRTRARHSVDLSVIKWMAMPITQAYLRHISSISQA